MSPCGKGTAQGITTAVLIPWGPVGYCLSQMVSDFVFHLCCSIVFLQMLRNCIASTKTAVSKREKLKIACYCKKIETMIILNLVKIYFSESSDDYRQIFMKILNLHLKSETPLTSFFVCLFCFPHNSSHHLLILILRKRFPKRNLSEHCRQSQN